MTIASAATPNYFFAKKVDGQVFISGDNVASSPAMFAAVMARDKYGVKMEDITLVSIGSTNQFAEVITKSVGLLDWADRITTLNAPVKQHAMDGMIRYLLRNGKNGPSYHKVQIDVERDWENELWYKPSIRKKKLEAKS